MATAYATFPEIMDQGEAWQATLDDLAERGPALRDYLRANMMSDKVIFTGCGSPYYLSLTAAALCRGETGLAAEAHPGSSLWQFPSMTLRKGEKPLLVVTSRSGATTELLQAVKRFDEIAGGPVLAITCYPASPLAGSPFALITQKCQEISLCQTRSFTSMLIDALGVIDALAGQPTSNHLHALPEHVATLLRDNAALAEQIGSDPTLDRFFFLGSAPYIGLANEAMLKMKEMSLTASEAYHFMEFRHGPMSMVNDRTLVVGLLSEAALPHELAVLAQMRRMGARTLALSPVPLDDEAGAFTVTLPPGLTDAERAPLLLPVLQLMTYHRTLLNGLNPDLPNNLSAVINLDANAVAGKYA